MNLIQLYTRNLSRQAYKHSQSQLYFTALEKLEKIKKFSYFDLRVKYQCEEGLQRYSEAFKTLKLIEKEFSLVHEEEIDAYLRVLSRLKSRSDLINFSRIRTGIKYKLEKRILLTTAQLLKNDYCESIVSQGTLQIYEEELNILNSKSTYRRNSQRYSSEGFLIEFINVQIFSESNWVINEKFAFHEHASNENLGFEVAVEKDFPCKARLDNQEVYLKLDEFKLINHSQGIWLGGWASKEFGHFFQSLAPRIVQLDLIDHLNGFTLFLDSNLPKNLKQLVTLLTDRKVEYVNPNTRVEFLKLFYLTDKVFCPPHLVSKSLENTSCSVVAENLKMIRDKIKVDKEDTGRLIYLTRNSSSWRKLENESEVEKYLVKKGFEIVDLYKLELLEIIKIFSSAKIIISPSSSGVLNSIFSKPGTKLVILLGGVFNERSLPCALNEFGIETFFYLEELPNSSKTRQSNYKINLKRFKKAMRTHPHFERLM